MMSDLKHRSQPFKRNNSLALADGSLSIRPLENGSTPLQTTRKISVPLNCPHSTISLECFGFAVAQAPENLLPQDILFATYKTAISTVATTSSSTKTRPPSRWLRAYDPWHTRWPRRAMKYAKLSLPWLRTMSGSAMTIITCFGRVCSLNAFSGWTSNPISGCLMLSMNVLAAPFQLWCHGWRS